MTTAADCPDYRDYYFLERFLEETVRRRFEHNESLSAFDFFCIVIWKANRAKSRIAEKLLNKNTRKFDDLDQAVKCLPQQIPELPLRKRR